MLTAEEIAREWSGWREEYTWRDRKEHDQILRDLDGAEILFAEYDEGGYDGDSTVIYRKEGKLYETYGGHCSCYGLDDQWSPQETSVEAILMRAHDYGTQATARATIEALRKAGVV